MGTGVGRGRQDRWHKRVGMVLVLLALTWPGSVLAETVAILAGRIITDAAAPPRGPATVIVEDGRIIAVNDGASAPPGARVIDLSGYTVMPGLIDTHVHLTAGPNSINRSREYGVAVALANASTLARAGFTTVRDLSSDPSFAQAVRDAIADGLHPGPRVQAAARASVAGAQGRACTGAGACADFVRRVAGTGADAIKIMLIRGPPGASGGPGQTFTDAELRAIVETADGLNLRVSAHASNEEDVESAARAGVDTIDHGTFGQDRAARLMRQNDVALVPTLSALISIRENLGRGGHPPEVEARYREIAAVIGRMFRAARRAGVRIVFGTDSGVFAHGRNAEEAVHMAALGMSPREVLVSATTAAADLLGLGTETGAITAGRAADIIAVEGDPLQDLTALQRVRFVMASGRVVREDRK